MRVILLILKPSKISTESIIGQYMPLKRYTALPEVYKVA
jgi:hypothetical protein